MVYEIIKEGKLHNCLKFIELIDDDQTILEQQPLESVAQMGELMAYKHKGFWQPMDTLRDKIYLEKLWLENNASWERK